jgi:hypothetical protein
LAWEDQEHPNLLDIKLKTLATIDWPAAILAGYTKER